MTKKKINAPYDNPFGIWHVTTEGDCEGRSTRDLGIHEGYIDEPLTLLLVSTRVLGQ